MRSTLSKINMIEGISSKMDPTKERINLKTGYLKIHRRKKNRRNEESFGDSI